MGDARCYHLHLFDPSAPRFLVHQSGADWLLERDAKLLDDQVLLFWSPRAREPHGVAQRGEYVVAGAYRIKSSRRSVHGNWEIEPYEKGWVDLSELHLRPPYGRDAGGKYFKKVDRSTLMRLFKEADERIDVPARTWSAAQKERYAHFRDSLDGWIDQAAKRLSEVLPDQGISDPEPAYQTPRLTNQPLKALRDLAISVSQPKAPVPDAREPEPAVPTGAIPAEAAKDVARLYGEHTLRSLTPAMASKPIVLFSGPSGSGKSFLAMRLIEDPKRERSLIVPVVSTWRGSEDLLGHVNPIDNRFEASPFTRFLVRSERAWNDGDRAPRVVVFEEFNLSRPEFWLSEVLTRSQYDEAAVEDRSIHLGGEGIRGLDGPVVTQVFLSPAILFIGTLNSDPSSPPLSSRVLDRAALIHLEVDPRAALATVGVNLEEPMAEAVYELDGILRERSVGFSLRAARSLAELEPRAKEFGIDLWEILDHVLAQEVLSKLSLFAADPADVGITERLADWSSGVGSRLTICGRLASEWSDRLENGMDVLQT